MIIYLFSLCEESAAAVQMLRTSLLQECVNNLSSFESDLKVFFFFGTLSFLCPFFFMFFYPFVISALPSFLHPPWS